MKPVIEKTAEEIRQDASIATHEILTHFWGFKSEEWDPEAWIVFHQLLILFSMRGKEAYEKWVMKVFSYSGGVIPILEEKEKNGATLLEEPDLVLKDYMALANVLFAVDPVDTNSGTIEINDAFRRNRNELIARGDDPFGYILTNSDLEVKTPYKEHWAHEMVHNALSQLKSNLTAARFKVRNFQFEVSKETKDRDVQETLFEYFFKKGFTPEESFLCTGHVYNEKGEFVCNTSVTVTKGDQNSVALITLWHKP